MTANRVGPLAGLAGVSLATAAWARSRRRRQLKLMPVNIVKSTGLNRKRSIEMATLRELALVHR